MFLPSSFMESKRVLTLGICIFSRSYWKRKLKKQTVFLLEFRSLRLIYLQSFFLDEYVDVRGLEEEIV
uniref:Uncharacterized protein n=1 Tax=Populus trichocarpa TaxID=3694 RepID=A0A2K1X2V9_POPTR